MSRVTIYLSNHPSSIPLPILIRQGLREQPHARMMAVLREDHKWNPVFGWPLFVTGGGIFIDRDNREKAIQTVEAALKKVRRDEPISFFVLPDRTRPKAKNIADDIARFKKKNDEKRKRQMEIKVPDEILARFQHTAIPRSGTIWTLLQGCPTDTRVIDFTISLDVPEEGTKDAVRAFGRTVHIHRADVTRDIPRHDEDTLRAWLIHRWLMKNELIANWRAHGDSITLAV